jgi:predicted porin
MQKKLIAVAIAGALGTPAAVLAQTSTVNIYGNITYEYGIGDQGTGRRNVDYADTPGGSAIGFRGEEKLGGGLSAWFQCETSADVRGIDQTGWCTRNSAVGFKGAFGNLHFGIWDTPFKRALNVGTVGAEETGLMGMSFLPFGGSGGADATGTSPDSVNRQRWKRREKGLLYYETPVFSGFQGLGTFSPGNHTADGSDSRLAPGDPVDRGTPNSKPRIWSIAGTYMAGPLGIGVGYEKHKQFGAYSLNGTRNLDDRAWGVSAAYTFAQRVKVGATYLDAKYETAPTTTLKKKTWTVGVDWNVAGPHSIQAQYAKAGDSKGNSSGAACALGGCGIGGNGGVEASGPDTGGDAWTIGYRYNFSKRTWVKIAYVRVDNDRLSNSYRIGNTASGLADGENVDSFAFRIGHRF